MLTYPVSSELQDATHLLSGARRAAVLAARTAWIESGLSLPRATHHAVRLAHRLQGKRLDAVRREARATSRAAAQHEAAFVQAYEQAVAAAQRAVPMAKLEAALAHGGDTPWHILEHVVQTLKDHLG